MHRQASDFATEAVLPVSRTMVGLKQRVLRAGGWSLLGHFASQAIRLGGNLIMTRLLVPELFGVMALAMAFMSGLAMFSDFGLQQVVVQHKDADKRGFLDTVWTIQILRGVGIFVAGLAMVAGLYVTTDLGLMPVGSAYAHPDLPRALAVISFGALLSGLSSTRLLTANRVLALGPIVRLELWSQLAGLAVMVSWAWLSPTVFAIASGALTAAVTRTLLSHFSLPGDRNRLFWSNTEFQTILRFSRWIFFTSILGFLIGSGDKLLLGALLGAGSFGIYTVAALLVGALLELVNKIVGSVLYPALSEVYRSDPQSLRSTYYRLRVPIDAVSCLAAGVLFVAGPEIVHMLYDYRYADAGGVVQILAIPLVLAGISSAGNLYMVIGKPWVVTLLIGVRLVALYVSAPFLVDRFGLPGGALAVCAGYFATVPFMYFFKARLGFLRVSRELLVVPFTGGGVLLGLALQFLLTPVIK